MSGMTAAVLALAFLTAAVSFAVRRRRRHPAGSLEPLPLPPGMKHLVAEVGSLSRFGMGLRMPPPRHGARRLGTLLGVR